MSSSSSFEVLVHFLHVGAAILAAGAAAFQLFAVHPSLAQLPPDVRRPIREAILSRWRPVVFASIAVLIITGLINFVAFKIPLYRGSPDKGIYHGLIGLKILAAFAAFHAATVLALPGPKGEKYRDNAGFWLKLLVGWLAVVVVLGTVLSRFHSA